MDDDNVLVADARVYLSIVHLLTSTVEFEVDDLLNIFNTLGSELGVGKTHRYTNLDNILALLLVYPSPTSISVDILTQLLHGVVKHACSTAEEGLNDTEDLHEDLEEFANWIVGRLNMDESHIFTLEDSVLLQTAYDVSSDSLVQCQKYDYAVDATKTQNELLFKFAQAKIMFLSQYSFDVQEFSPLFQTLEGYKPFQIWYSGLIEPFRYYWDNYGSLSNSVNLYEFLKVDTFYEKFTIFIGPLNMQAYSKKLTVDTWITVVIMPLIAYYEFNFKPLLDWLFKNNEWNAQDPCKKYGVWSDAIKSISSFKCQDDSLIHVSEYKDILKYFLASCYYYAIFYETAEKVTSIEILRIYDTIDAILSSVKHKVHSSEPKSIGCDMDFESLKSTSSLESFIEDSDIHLKQLFEPNSSTISFLQDIITTCEKLYPINKFTIFDFLKLKYSKTSDFAASEREVARILTNLDSNNWSQILSSARLFTGSFITENETQKEEINKLIIDRFLYNNLFDVVGTFYNNNELPIPVGTFFNLVSKKFWESFNQASNFNTKLGRLHESSQCIELFDKISAGNALSDGNRNEIIKIKHLFKAVSNVKNFKMDINKGKPFTPGQLVNLFGSVSEMESIDPDEEQRSPMALISTILEQNPKSYLAFEKLYKILNDLLIFFNDSTHEATFFFIKLKSICIESALIDNNFPFAYRQSIELFNHYSNNQSEDLNDFWLTFYQVGKYVSPEWFNESSSLNDKIEVLIKQREVLSKTLKFTKQTDKMIDNSRLILRQWEKINLEIEDWYRDMQQQDYNFQNLNSSKDAIPESMTDLANDIMNDATNTTNQASEKLSNLFVSGLGWAIGASRN